MKTATLCSLLLATAAVFLAAPLRAQETKPEVKSGCKKKQSATEKEIATKAGDVEFEKLLDEMNASIGDKKMAAMAAVLNKLVQKQKEMKAKCDAMMAGGMMKKDDKAELKSEAKSGELDHYTCTMHPAVRWPVPVKCPLCSMDLVPVFKKLADVNTGEDSKKGDDPHAGHR